MNYDTDPTAMLRQFLLHYSFPTAISFWLNYVFYHAVKHGISDTLLRLVCGLVGLLVADMALGTYRAWKEGRFRFRVFFWKNLEKPCSYFGAVLMACVLGGLARISDVSMCVMATGLTLREAASVWNNISALRPGLGPYLGVYIADVIESARKTHLQASAGYPKCDCQEEGEAPHEVK